VGPLLVDVLLLLIDDLGAVLVDVRLLAGLLVQQVDFIPESGEVEVPLQPLVLALQRLDSAEIMAHAVVVEGLCLVLLRDPFLGLVPVPVEHLHLMSTLEGGTLLVGHILQLGLLLVEVLQLRLDLHGLTLAQYLHYFQPLCPVFVLMDETVTSHSYSITILLNHH
jgi:hypothetical protein